MQLETIPLDNYNLLRIPIMHCTEKFCPFLHSILEVLESDTNHGCRLSISEQLKDNARSIVNIVILSLKLACPNFKQRWYHALISRHVQLMCNRLLFVSSDNLIIFPLLSESFNTSIFLYASYLNLNFLKFYSQCPSM